MTSRKFERATDLEKNMEFMQAALDLAKAAEREGEVPVGAVIVKDGKVVGQGQNRKESLNLATRHAEIEAIEDASKNLDAWRLEDCDLYVTLEPCLMCAGAIVASRIKKVYYGTDDPKGGAVKSLYQALNDSRLNHKCEVEAGLLKDECSQILKDFFKAKREKSEAGD